MYQLTASNSLSKNSKPRSTRKEALRMDEETGLPYVDYAQHIDKDRTAWNKVLVNRDVKAVYQEHVGGAVDAYNAKQVSEGRYGRLKTVEGYMADIVKGENAGNSASRPRLWNDITTQLGNMDTNEAWVVDDNGRKVQPKLSVISNEVYREFVEQFEERYPNLVVTLAVVHNDESTPHLQLQYVPFCHKNKRGLRTQVKLCDALAEALDRVGVPYNRKKEDNIKQAFNADLDRMLESIMLSHGIQRIPGDSFEVDGKKTKGESMVEYRKRHRILRSEIGKLMKNAENPLDMVQGISIPFKGVYYSESEERGIIKDMLKESAVKDAMIKNLRDMVHSAEFGIKEQKKRTDYEFKQREIAIEEREKRLASAQADVALLKAKLQNDDEQRRYKRLADEAHAEKERLARQIADGKTVLQNARRDAAKMLNDAREEASSLVAEAQGNVKSLYVELESSSVVRKKKDDIKLKLLKERYPDVDDILDSLAGHAVLKGGRQSNKGKGLSHQVSVEGRE